VLTAGIRKTGPMVFGIIPRDPVFPTEKWHESLQPGAHWSSPCGTNLMNTILSLLVLLNTVVLFMHQWCCAFLKSNLK
jgi:hypothetical protein